MSDGRTPTELAAALARQLDLWFATGRRPWRSAGVTAEDDDVIVRSGTSDGPA